MKIVQWNTHHGGIGSDAKLNTARIAESIKLNIPDADVICLNEVEQNDGYGNHDCVAIWCATLGLGWNGIWATISGTFEGRGQSNVILSRLPMSGINVRPLTKTRVGIGAVINGRFIVSTHLDADSSPVRCAQLFQLLSWPGLPAVDAGPVILCGDWNSHDGMTEQAPLQMFWTDAWKQSVKNKTNTSFNGTGNTKSSRIDAIFYRGSLSLQKCDVPDMRMNGILPSDHSPVVATFS